jgi:hypothetical protein
LVLMGSCWGTRFVATADLLRYSRVLTQGWDLLALEEWLAVGHGMAVLTHYPPAFEEMGEVPLLARGL